VAGELAGGRYYSGERQLANGGYGFLAVASNISDDYNNREVSARFRFATNGGTVLQDEHGLLWEGSVRGVRFQLAANERLYGGGERGWRSTVAVSG